MNYYQITADIEEFEDDEDDPNWLLTTFRQPTQRQTTQTPTTTSRQTLQTSATSQQTTFQTMPSNVTSSVASSVNENVECNINGLKNVADDNMGDGVSQVGTSFKGQNGESTSPTMSSDVCRQNESTRVERKVVLRRQKSGQNNSSKDNRTSFYRFSRLIEGVASYVSTKTLPEEETSFHNLEQNYLRNEMNGHDVQTSRGVQDTSPSSIDSGGFESVVQSRQNDVDPIDAKITEIFESIEAVPVYVPESPGRDVRRRRRHVPDNPETVGTGFFQRRKQTVSAYFSDWAKWITNVEDVSDPFHG